MCCVHYLLCPFSESDEDDGLRKLPEEKCADRVRHMLNGAESVTAL